ncbi:MAG: nucleoside triphosphate pyrophosphohydrolase [Spirochaetales bacterium]
MQKLVDIMERLRAPDGCPWDREQTPESLLKYLLEESAELVEAVQSGDPNHVKEELGDVLLQVVFHAQMASEAGHFSVSDVVDTICDKMIRRHPHVFGDALAETSEDVKRNWDVIKAAEKASKTGGMGAQHESALDTVAKSLPTLMRAQELQKRASRAGFDFRNPAEVVAKVREELEELEHEIASGDRPALAEEYGDLLFAVGALGRKLGLDAETALIAGNAKYERRFRRMEVLAGGSQELTARSLHEQEELWIRVKSAE